MQTRRLRVTESHSDTDNSVEEDSMSKDQSLGRGLNPYQQEKQLRFGACDDEEEEDYDQEDDD